MGSKEPSLRVIRLPEQITSAMTAGSNWKNVGGPLIGIDKIERCPPNILGLLSARFWLDRSFQQAAPI